MTCDDYLAMLETLPVEDLMHGSARDHAAQCHDCNRVTRVVIERERSMIMAYGDVNPLTPMTTLESRAVASARRQRVSFITRAALGLAAVGAILFVVISRIVPKPLYPAEYLRYRCLGPEEAISIIRPYVSEQGSIAYHPEGGATLRVSAPPRELQAARFALDQAISSTCSVLPAPAPGTSPPADRR